MKNFSFTNSHFLHEHLIIRIIIRNFAFIYKQEQCECEHSKRKQIDMKVLIVFREDDTDNLFVHILCRAIREQGVIAHCSLRDFWEKNEPYDIIHFQWPEEVVGWNCHNPDTVKQLQQRIDYFRSLGTRFVYTRHNTAPHYANPVIRQAYEVIESCSDTVVHMGRYSQCEFQSRYPDSRSVVIPHPIYEHTYNENISRAEARRKLNIPEDRFVITAFGKFRNNDEIRMVLKSFLRLRMPKKFLLAPRMLPFSKKPGHRNAWKRALSYVGYRLAPLLLKLCNVRAGASEELVDNSELHYYIAASDLIFVQRKRILNSGNVPLAFLFHKVVIGPYTGNVGELLQETGNPAFDPNDTKSIVQALKQAKQLSEAGKGEENYQYARRFMNLKKVAAAYVEVYNNSF